MTTLERIPSGVAAPDHDRRRCHVPGPRGGRPHRRPSVRRPARPVAALLHPGEGARRGPVHRRHRLRRLEHPRLPAHPRVGHAAHARPDDGLRRPDPRDPDADPDAATSSSPAAASRTAATRATSPARPSGISPRAASPRPRSGARRSSSTSSTRCASTPPAIESMYEIDSDEGIWNSGRNGTPNLAHRPRPKEGYFPVPPMDTLQDLRSRMVLAMQASGIDVEVQHHEVGGPGQAEIDIRYGTLVETADKVLRYKYIVKQTAPRGRQGRDVHAQAAVRRQRLGHAHPPEPLEGRHQPLLRREGLRAAVGHGALVHRRAAQARQGGAGLRGADDQLLPPAGPRLRGADQPRLLPAQPLGVHPHPDVLHDARAPAGWSSARPTRPATRTFVQRAAAGRPRRRHQQDRAADAGRRATSTS